MQELLYETKVKKNYDIQLQIITSFSNLQEHFKNIVHKILACSGIGFYSWTIIAGTSKHLLLAEQGFGETNLSPVNTGGCSGSM